jgi:two-component system, NarL family, sensor histidine kinase DesK
MDHGRGERRGTEAGQGVGASLNALPRGVWPFRSRRLGWHLGTLIWLVYFVPVIAGLLSGPVTAGDLQQLVLLGLFIAGYVYVLLRPPWIGAVPLPGRPLVLAVIAVAMAILVLHFDESLISLLVYFDVALTMLLPIQWAVRAVLLASAAAAAVGLWRGQEAGTVALTSLQTLLAGAAVLAFRRMAGLNQQLREAGEDLAELAVTEERLRFARDLHDLLGHSLSLIVLKSELVEQLLEADPARAVSEVRDIKQVARRSLAEVREAVGGYRRVTLATETAGARAALGAAGIAYTIEEPPDGLPDRIDEVLGWAVREGVTNVVRHSGASTCRIHFECKPGRAGDGSGLVAVEITDSGGADGRAGAAPAGGSGLAGLAERAAEHGGRLQAGPRRGGGFRLRVELPR